MISENNKRIRAGDSIYVWSEQNSLGFGSIDFMYTETNIVLKNYNNRIFKISPLYEDYMSGLKKIEKIKNDRKTDYSLGWIGRIWGQNDIQIVATSEIDWYELNQTFNME